jgi:transposase
MRLGTTDCCLFLKSTRGRLSCCGLDVHKSSITACVVHEQEHKPQKHLQRFGCTTRDLLELVRWLKNFGVQHVAMESTGIYWKPMWNVLEEHFQMRLANAQHIKAVPSRKTAMKDCQWLAELLKHGLVHGSYVPNVLIRDLRDLTRTRPHFRRSNQALAVASKRPSRVRISSCPARRATRWERLGERC